MAFFFREETIAGESVTATAAACGGSGLVSAAETGRAVIQRQVLV